MGLYFNRRKAFRTSTFPVNSSAFTAASSHYFDGGNNYNFGSSDWGISFWYKRGTVTSAMSLIGKYAAATVRSWDITVTPVNTRVTFDYSTDGTNIAASFDYTSFTQTQDVWYHIVITRNGNDGFMYIDGSQVQTFNFTGVTIFNSTAALEFGGLDAISAIYLQGGMYGASIITGDYFTSTDVSNLYNANAKPLCYDDLGATKTKIDSNGSFWRLGNYDTNSGSELTDLAGSINLTNPNSTPFTGSGLNVECSA
jgi:hypothetical protein